MVRGLLASLLSWHGTYLRFRLVGVILIRRQNDQILEPPAVTITQPHFLICYLGTSLPVSPLQFGRHLSIATFRYSSLYPISEPRLAAA